MYTLFYFRVLRRLQALIEKAIKPLYTHKNCSSLFPLSSLGNLKIASSNGIYWRKLQASFSPVIGMTSDREAEILFFLSTIQDIRGDVMEIGSWLGKSTVHLASGCQLSGNGIVHAIDTFGGNLGKEDLYTTPLEKDESIYARFKKNIALAKLTKYIKIHKKSSEDVDAEIQENIRLAFIDGCHDYKLVLHDIKLCSKKLLPNGVIVLDDFTSYFPGVVQAAQEEIINNKQFEVLCTVDSLFIARKK